MSTLPATKRWLVRNVRKLVGNEQVMQALHQQTEMICRRLTIDSIYHAHLPADQAPQAGPIHPWSPDLTSVLINGDPVVIPRDLLPFIDHCLMPAPDSEIPHILIETPHYCWIKDRLHVGANVLDVGANIGLFSIMMARRIKYGLIGGVHSFEPSPRSRRDLNRMLTCNQIPNVTVHAEAVADRCGKATFHGIQTNNMTRKASHLSMPGREGFGGSLPQSPVEVDTIDLDTFTEKHSFNPHSSRSTSKGPSSWCLREPDGASSDTGRRWSSRSTPTNMAASIPSGFTPTSKSTGTSIIEGTRPTTANN